MSYQRAFVFGETCNGLAIPGYKFGDSGPEIFIVGGVHGDEYEGVIAAHGLLKAFSQSFPYKLNLTLVPTFNIDGVLKGTRKNANDVDLNRNLPTQDWHPEPLEEKYYPGPAANSEVENQALVEYIQSQNPKFIISLHSWKPMLNVNGNCDRVARVLNQHTGYEITPDIGYPTPGSLGTYTGLERQIPTITYEFERKIAAEKIMGIHVPAIMESLKELENQ